MKDIVSDMPARPTGVVMTTACEELVSSLCRVQDHHVLSTEFEVVYLSILSSPFGKLGRLLSVETC